MDLVGRPELNQLTTKAAWCPVAPVLFGFAAGVYMLPCPVLSCLPYAYGALVSEGRRLVVVVELCCHLWLAGNGIAAAASLIGVSLWAPYYIDACFLLSCSALAEAGGEHAMP